MANEKRNLIEREDLIDSLGVSDMEIFAKEVIGDASTVDAVEVVHGQWVFGTANHREYMKCSVCLKSQTPTGVFTYCPNCGAKMDGDGNG